MPYVDDALDKFMDTKLNWQMLEKTHNTPLMETGQEAELAHATSDQRVAAVVRQMIVEGDLAPGEKLSEVGIAAQLNVSRTPARLALRTLELEGFIRKRDGRGFVVNCVEFNDIVKAYQVRGVLEGLAARLLAHEGIDEENDARLKTSLAMSRDALKPGRSIDEMVKGYQEANTLFHNTIMQSCGNDFVGYTYTRLSGLPLLRLGVLVFDREAPQEERGRLQNGHNQHAIIYDAIKSGDQVRAEAMMREHSNMTLHYAKLLNSDF